MNKQSENKNKMRLINKNIFKTNKTKVTSNNKIILSTKLLSDQL